ncbi:MAG: helix-turn-helix transcriptional regulator [Actinobacteria bacterium]|uniref:Unannotated protein n=1 Tax=freshwater metagenome TaxID=449393 RepID=A0A6J7D8I6_9ZZZZ|nr:helix-turn-helix transcriptional regulator [Actinomycetota bacterium]
MAGPLIETKFRIPVRRRGHVMRSRLHERLTLGTESSVTLLSAPAGFGKTTLLADWLATTAADGRSVAWLSLDERDSDPAIFWPYVVAALRAAGDGPVASALARLHPAEPPFDTAIAVLLNELSGISHDIVLILDDYHVIDSEAVHEGMAFFLEHIPAHLHLVIAGRADPAVPLARLRGRGELTEIRAADLRFTPSEAADYLTGTVGLTLTASDVAKLADRTEGWIAALQLAALSMQGRVDTAGFIAGFAGDDRYIIDYLAQEVLLRQPSHVRQFLLQTSILDRLCAPLCEAVTGQDAGQATLAQIERANLFLVPLDDRRRWYRYHQLFAEVLRAHLLDEQPGSVPDLHRRASIWCDQNDEPSEAIRHALAARDFARAADLIELAVPAKRRARQEVVIRQWLTALPDEVLAVRPVICAAYAGALLATGDIDGVDARLRQAEEWLDVDATGSAQMVIVDREGFRLLPGSIEVYRAALAMARGDVPTAVAHAQRALDISPKDDHLGRAAAAGMLALAAWFGGELEGAHQAWSDCMTGLEHAGHESDAVGCAIALAGIRVEQGRLSDAMRTYRHALDRAPEPGGATRRGTADMHVGMSEILLERGDIDGATLELRQSSDLGEHAGLAQNRYRWRVAMARIRMSQGDPDGSIALLDEAERCYISDFYPNIRPISAMRARVWASQGAVGKASGWVHEQGLSAEDDLSYLREFEHITLARVLLAQHAAGNAGTALDDAARLLERLLRAAEDGARVSNSIEILVLLALARQSQNQKPAASAALHRALALAMPEGYVRVFSDEGSPMATLLRGLPKQADAVRSYVRLLLDASSPQLVSAATHQHLIDPLSARELDVLRLLSSDLDGPGISRALFISLNTMRSHTKSIYSKLEVTNRRSAVRRANELDLL